MSILDTNRKEFTEKNSETGLQQAWYLMTEFAKIP